MLKTSSETTTQQIYISLYNKRNSVASIFTVAADTSIGLVCGFRFVDDREIRNKIAEIILKKKKSLSEKILDCQL